MDGNQWENFSRLFSALAGVFAQEGRTGGKHAASALLNARANQYRRTASLSDPAGTLEAACNLPEAIPAAQLVLECAALFDWTSWEGSGLSGDVSANLYTTELVGPDGHFPAEHVRVGLLLSEAGTDYPVSSHSGEETYLVIAGEAEWIVGDEAYVAHPPGTLVHHPAWAPHGRRTGEQPFLGAWRWSGDLDLTTFSVA